MSGLTYAKKHIDLMFARGSECKMDLRHIARTYFNTPFEEVEAYFNSRAAKADPCRFDDNPLEGK